VNPLVSIIIPCLNAACWLGETIASCLDQTWPDIEIIVVDNGSSDDSIAIARRFPPDKITLLACERPGAAAARNAGLARACGAFIQYLDADDLLHRDKIRAQVERLAAAPALSLASAAWSRFSRHPSEAGFDPEAVWSDLSPEEFLITSWLGGGMMPVFAWLTPRAVIDAAGAWDESLSVHDDGEYFTRVALAASGIIFCHEARGYYRTGAAPTISRRRDSDGLASVFAAIELSCAHLLERRDTARARQACAAHYQRFVYDVYPLVPDLAAIAERRVGELGGSDLRLGGGACFQLLSRCVGWKAARQCQQRWRRWGARVCTAAG
jgi:glycosyltransferase involved in cell wall biosynthesis